MSNGVVTNTIRTISGRVDGFVTRHPFLTGGIVLTVAIPLAVFAFDWADWVPSEKIIIQLIASTGLVLVALGPIYHSNRKKHAATAENIEIIKHEVKNDHNTNLRVESDQRHAENVAYNQRVLDEIKALRGDIQGLRTEGGRQDDRIFRIEQAVFPPITPQKEQV